MTAPAHIPERTVTAIVDRLRTTVWTQADIADDLGISRSIVEKVAKDHGLGKQRAATVQPPRRRSHPRPASLDWQDRAACAGQYNFTDMTVDQQKRFCRTVRLPDGTTGCPVRYECLQYGLAGPLDVNVKQSEGTVFGGYGPKELIKLRREMAK